MAQTQEPRIIDRPTFNKLLIVFAAATWGFSFVVMKDLVGKVPVFWLLALRFALATLVMVVALWGRFIGALRDHKTRLLGLMLGITGFGAYAFQTLGLALTTPGKNSFLTGSYCVMVPFVVWAFGMGRPRLRHVAAAVFCLAGIGLVALDSAGEANAGDLLTLGGALCYALQFACLAKWGRDADELSATGMQFGVMALCSLGATLVLEPGFAPEAFTPADIGALAFLVLICSCFNFVALNRGMTRVNSTEGSILSSLEAPFGVLSSVLFYAEPLSLRLVAGFALIFVSILVCETGE